MQALDRSFLAPARALKCFFLDAYSGRMLPDLTFSGSDASPTPQVVYTLYPLQNSGSGTGTAVTGNVTKQTGAQYTVTEGFTGQINTRVRGRQLILKVSSTNLGTTWQLGATRIDIRPDGRR